MKLFARPWPRRSLSIRRRSCISCSHLTSSSSLSGPMGPLPGSPLFVRHPRCCHLPRLLPPLPIEGRGRNFEGSSPSSQPQMGGVLGQHWLVWQSFEADDWTVAVLQDGCRVRFHHLPPVTLNQQELLSCSPGSVRAVALREEVSKMLLKGSGNCGTARSRFLQLTVSGGEGDVGLAACH